MPDRFDKFSERARRVLEFAQQQARQHGHSLADTEHLLLGILDDGEGVAARVLATIAGDLDGLRAAVEARMAPAEEAPTPEPALAPLAKRAIEFAVDEARRFNQGYIGTEHLLLGLVHLDRGVALQVLHDLGLAPERIRAETAHILPVQTSVQPAAVPFAPGHATLSREPVDVAHLPRELIPLYSLVLRLRDARDAALFAGKSDVLAVVRSQEEQMQRLLEERVSARLSEKRSTEQ